MKSPNIKNSKIFKVKCSRLRKLKILQTSTIMMTVLLMIAVIVLGILAIRGEDVLIGKKDLNEEILADTETTTYSVGTNVEASFNSDTGEVTVRSTEGIGEIEPLTWHKVMVDSIGKTNIKTINFSNKVYGCNEYISGGGSGGYGFLWQMSNLTEIKNISNLDTSKITNMAQMFYGCSSLTNLDLSSFDTSHVTGMECMFEGCSSLTSLNISSFRTNNVTSMASMFYNCRSLTNIDLSKFDTSRVTSMNRMFTDCQALTNLDLRNFETNSLTDVLDMFYNCTSVEVLDIRNFDVSKITDSSNVTTFMKGCENAKEIYTPKKYPTAKNVYLPYRNKYYNVADMKLCDGGIIAPGTYSGSVHLVAGYKIEYDSNGGTGTMNDQIKLVTVDDVKILASSFTAPSGKVFANWNTRSGGNGDPYNVGDSYSEDADLTLYAQWEDAKANVELHLNNGVLQAGQDIKEYTPGTPVTLPTPTRKGYRFDGWYNNGSFTGEIVTEIKATDTGDKDFYAKWTPKQYTVELEENGGTIKSGNDVTSYTYDTQIELPTLKKLGYTFKGWYRDNAFADGPVESITAEEIKQDTEGLTLRFYAKWEANTYTINYELNDGENEDDAITSYIYSEEDEGDLPTPTRAGYTFAGWYKDLSLEGNAVTNIREAITEDMEELTLTFYAKWEAGTDTKYVVKHWKQKLDGNANIENDQNYELADTENKTGTTGEMVTPPVKDYVGFISPTPKTEQILADGSLEVNYYYRRNTEGSYVIVHHYIYDEEAEQEQDKYTKTQLVADEIKEGVYGQNYTTSVSSGVPKNYECINENPTGCTGTYATTPIEVSYYYKLLTPSIVDNIRKEVTSATNEAGEVVLTKEDQGVSYRITYNTRVTNYIGKVTIKIVDTLPAKIDLTKSNIEEGDYDENSRTITWTKDVMVDTFEDGDYVEEIIKDITLVYKDQDVAQNLVNRVKGETITYYPDGHVEDKKDEEFESGEAESNVIVKQEYKANFKVVKVWDDNGNINGKRPESVTIQIRVMPNNQVTTQVLNAQNNWTYEEKGINKYNADGEKITYIVTESETVAGDLQHYNDAVITNEETQTEEVTNYTYTVTNTYNNTNQGSFNNTTITKEGPSEITSTEEKANYTINFRSELSNYIGGGRVTIVDTLPFAIDKENSILDGGVYDEQAKTITWTEELGQINTDTLGASYIINITKEISLAYKDIDLTKEKMTNTVTGRIELDSSDTVEVGTTGADTDINVEGKVIVKYVDVETEEEIQGEAEEGTYSYEITGAVGEKYETDKKEIPYYVYVKDTENTEGEIGKEETTVIYYYRKMIYNFSMEKTLEGVTLNGQVLNIKDNKLVKVELKSAEVNKAEIIARYNIKVTNDGELAGKVKVLERVPKGFEMVTTPAYWTKNADGTLEAEVELGVGESKELAVTLKWINDEGNLGSISNKAELIGGSNTANYDDTNKDDDSSEATIIVSIKTGWQVSTIITITIIMSMIIIGGLMIIIIRKKGPHINDIEFLNK